MRTSLGLQVILITILLPAILAVAACKPTTTTSDTVEALIEQGIELADAGRYEEAIQEYNKAIEIDSKNPEVYFYRGNAYTDKGDTDKAIADFTMAIELDPTNANSYYNRGLGYADEQDLDKAIADFTKVIELDADYAFAYYNRALAYCKKGEPDQAIADCTKTIEIMPDHAKSYNVRGISYSLKGEFNNAINDFREALLLDPTLNPVGEMSLYEGIRIPLSIEYPASWSPSSDSSLPPSYPLIMRHSIIEFCQLTITEPTFAEIGLFEMSLDAYADDVISANEIISPDLLLISQNYIDLPTGGKAEVIVFSTDSGQRMFYRLIYIHEKSCIFNMTYSYRPLVADIRPIIHYSFATFRVFN